MALRAARADVEEVVLYGSLARGDAVPGSDADVAVVIEAASPLARRPPADRPSELTQAFAEVGIGVDLVVATREELSGGPLWRNIQAEGVRVA